MTNPIPLPSIEKIRQFFLYENGVLFYAKNGKEVRKIKEGRGYYSVSAFGRQWKYHRIVYAVVTGLTDFGFIDHINGDRRDNRFENLRTASDNENTWNKKCSSNNKLGVKGVRLYKGKYQARIMAFGVSHSKIFDELDQAVKWLQNKRKSLHLAFLNNG